MKPASYYFLRVTTIQWPSLKGVNRFVCESVISFCVKLIPIKYRRVGLMMEVPYFVKELLELSLIMRARERWAQNVNGTAFWQPWLDKGTNLT